MLGKGNQPARVSFSPVSCRVLLAGIFCCSAVQEKGVVLLSTCKPYVFDEREAKSVYPLAIRPRWQGSLPNAAIPRAEWVGHSFYRGQQR